MLVYYDDYPNNIEIFGVILRSHLNTAALAPLLKEIMPVVPLTSEIMQIALVVLFVSQLS